MPLTASGSNIDVSGIVTGSMALFWTKSATASCAHTTMSGPVPCWLAVLNCVVRFSAAMAWTSTVTPLSVAHCWASGLIAAARLSSAQMTSFAPLAPADAPVDGAASDGAAADAAPLAAAVAGAAVAPPDPPLEHGADDDRHQRQQNSQSLDHVA